MTRRRRVSVSEDVVRHSPVPFDDSDLDSLELQESVTSPSGALSYRRSPLFPTWRPRGVYLRSEEGPGEWGGTPHARPVARAQLPSVVRVGARSARAIVHAKQILRAIDARRRVLFNRVAVPFSRRADVCVKRKARREVIFATRFNGRNGGKRYRRTYVSSYAC